MRILENKAVKRFIQAVRTYSRTVVALVLVFVMASVAVFANFAGDGFIWRNHTYEGYTYGTDFPTEDDAFSHNLGDVATTNFSGFGEHIYQEYFTITVARGQSIADVLPEIPQMKGINFTHWSLTPNGAPFNFNQPLYVDTTFYAIWDADYVHTCSLPDDGYTYDTPDYPLDESVLNEAPGYSYDIYGYGDSYDVYNHGYDTHDYSHNYHTHDHDHGHNNAAGPSYAYGYDYAMYYDYGHAVEHELAFAYDEYSHIPQAPVYMYSDYLYNEGPSYDFAYSYGMYYEYGHAVEHELAYASEGYGYMYSGYLYNEGPSYAYSYNHDTYYSHGYTYNYEVGGAYNDAPVHDTENNAHANNNNAYDNIHEDTLLYVGDDTNYEQGLVGDGTIVITFRLNPDGRWYDGVHIIHHDGDINIDVDARGNITVYPDVTHMVILDGEYIRVRFPWVVSLDNISVGMVNGAWTYAIYHDESPELSGRAGALDAYGQTQPFEIEPCTVVSINHDLLITHAQQGEMVFLNDYVPAGGFMPFASNPPFSMVTLASPFDNAAWLAAIDNTAPVDRVVVVPQDVYHPVQVNITGDRHVIIVSQDTNMQGTTNNHIAPPGGAVTITHTGTSGRHFTVAVDTTLTLSHIVLDGDVILPSTAFVRGGVTVNNGGNFHMLQGSVIRNGRFHGGGGVNLAAGTLGVFTMAGNSSITGNSSGNTGGGVQIAGGRQFTMSDNSSISGNMAATQGGGVNLTAANAHLTMTGNSSISGNTASTNGGGVLLAANNTWLTMDGGIISGNTANGPDTAAGGGGVHIAAVVLNANAFTLNNGIISNNHAVANGGGIFAALHTYSNYMTGTAYFPQLNIQAAAIFSGNTAGGGSFTPPVNAHLHTNIANTNGVSGGYNHPLNNLDINFFRIGGDWFRLHSAVVGTSAANIVIHPRDSSETPGLSVSGTTYNLVITDPGDGYTITTFPLTGGTSAHAINVTRPVTISAAVGSDIVLRMPLPGAPNTPNTAPWLTTQAEPTLFRHFIVGTGGILTLGGGAGSGTLTLDGNAALNTAPGRRRGGVQVTTNAELVLQHGGVIYNCAAHSGGGVELNASTATFNMTGGSIIANTAIDLNWGAALAGNGGGVSLLAAGSQFNMSGGTISGNTAVQSHFDWVTHTGNGGGVFLGNSTFISFNFSAGSIINNHAYNAGGGIFAGIFDYAITLPAGAFHQLTVGLAAVFGGNTSGLGGFNPPTNPGPPTTNITAAASRSGGFLHPLNNLDINFFSGDWIRLNDLVSTIPFAGNTHITIHPAGSGVTPGNAGDGFTYNFIIQDPGNGSTIVTSPIAGAPGTDPHRIHVLRNVTIQAADGANIVLDMTFTQSYHMGRHFLVNAGHLTLGGLGTGTLTLNGNADTIVTTGIRGGVQVNSSVGRLTLATGGIIANNRAISGGGVQLSAGGVGPHLVMAGGSIINNIATGSGGGVNLQVNNTHVNMDSGIISGNTATSNGGGVFLAAGINIRFHFNGGTIQNNTATIGGGIFATQFIYEDPLPTGMHFPQLTVSTNANFTGNVATIGGFTPPVGAATYTAITNANQRSGGFAHPLNNLDINFVSPNADWLRLNAAVQNAAIDTIIIHPRIDISGVTEGIVGPVFNMVITNTADPFAIITLPTGVGTSHAIYVTSPVVIQSAGNHDIVLNMLQSGSTMRHFNVTTNGNLTLGSQGTGTLALEANRQLVAGTRGGIGAGSNGIVNLQSGAIVRNTRGGTGGAIFISNTAVVNMYDGSYVTGNQASGGAIATQHWDHDATLNMFGGTINNNIADWGGGIWAMSGRVNIYGGYVINNNAGIIGTQAPNAGALDGTINNPHGAGGGIRVCCRGVLVMHGGTIGGNTARFGGGVLLSHGTTVDDPVPSLFIMYGGNIINNTASLAYVNPLNQHDGWVHNGDGGGVFIMSSGLFEMRDHPTENRTINISGNTAGQHGGGVFWQVGRWETDDRLTQPVIMQNNHAEYDGGAIFLSFRTLNMRGSWNIGNNSANRGGGVFLHGDNTPYTYDPTLGWLPHPLMGHGTLVMHDENVRIHSNYSETSGGGVYIFRDAVFEMNAGSIDNNESAIFGGGVYVFNPGTYFTSRFYARGGQITRNRAIYGGGVYLMFRAHMFAENVLFAGNEAARMGGGIFTELVDYGYLLSGMEVPHEILPEIPGHPLDPNEDFFAFTNINIADTVRFGGYSHDGLTYFGGNTAIAAFPAPYNALDLTNIRWQNWNAPNPVDRYQHLSIHIHPFNNYDINYVRPVYFYKTDMEIYSYPPSINNLQGAVFVLEISVDYDPVTSTHTWEVYTLSDGTPVTATSEANGRIVLFVFTEGIFRLTETVPPEGLFVPPPGYWTFEMRLDEDFIDGVPGLPDLLLSMYNPPPEPCPDNQEFFFVLLDRETETGVGHPYSDDARMRWHVGNAPPRVELYLHKAGEEFIGMSPAPTTVEQIDNMLRPGAVFLLYRYLGTGTPDPGLVPGPGWVRTYGYHTSTGNPTTPIELIRLAFRADQSFSYYQLVEAIPPPGYMAPFGQWRVRMEYNLAVAQTATAMVVTPQGESAPPLIRLTGENGFTFAVGNRRVFQLPLAGGMGMSMFMLAGGAILSAAALAAAMLVFKKKLAAKPALSRYHRLMTFLGIMVVVLIGFSACHDIYGTIPSAIEPLHEVYAYQDTALDIEIHAFSWQEAYSEKLHYYVQLPVGDIAYEGAGWRFMLHDINQSGTPQLFLVGYYDGLVNFYTVYSFEYGNAIMLKSALSMNVLLSGGMYIAPGGIGVVRYLSNGMVNFYDMYRLYGGALSRSVNGNTASFVDSFRINTVFVTQDEFVDTFGCPDERVWLDLYEITEINIQNIIFGWH